MAITWRDAVGCNDSLDKLDKIIDNLDDKTINKEPLKDVLERMLTFEPKESLSIKEVQEHT